MGSRRHCEELIAGGRVAVNGHVAQLGAKADPDKDSITIDGQPLQAEEGKLYILLNKPVGYTSTRFDRYAKQTVLDLVPEVKAFLYPVGRLDVDTSGLILLTNDGELANALTHPSHEVEKTYVAEIRGRISAQNLRKLAEGLMLDDGPTAPAKVRLLSHSDGTNTSTVEITIHEGRKRQVRRMLAAVGHRVIRLTRVRMGSLDLSGVAEGQHRFLTKKEVSELRKLASRQRAQGAEAGGRGERS